VLQTNRYRRSLKCLVFVQVYQPERRFDKLALVQLKEVNTGYWASIMVKVINLIPDSRACATSFATGVLLSVNATYPTLIPVTLFHRRTTAFGAIRACR